MEVVSIPDDLWEDWTWFITPHELRCTVVEDEMVVEPAKVAVTPIYTLNLPKMVMNDVSLVSRLEFTDSGVVDTGIIDRDILVTVEDIIGTISQLLLNCPLVVRPANGHAGTRFSDVADGLEVCFFNPMLIDTDEGSRDLFCIEPPTRCVEELSTEGGDGRLAEAVRRAVEELVSRSLIEMVEGKIIKITDKGKRLIETEPLGDRVLCSYQMRPLS